MKNQLISEFTSQRRAIVHGLVTQGMNANEIYSTLKTRGVVNPQTNKNYSRQTIINDLKQRPNQEQVTEIIGRWTLIKPLWNARILLNVDKTWVDYRFYDLLRYGMQPGYELSSLYCKPIAMTITSYVLGTGITASLMAHALTQDYQTQPAKSKSKKNTQKTLAAPDPEKAMEYTNAVLRRMMERSQGFFQTLIYDLLCLGDQYIVVNPDCTFSIVSPETVTVEYADSDYRRPVKYTIKNKLGHAIVEDTYTDSKRTLSIQYFDGQKPFYEEYENLIGRIPIIHLSNEKTTNEIYGHSIFEPLLPFFRKYDDLFIKTIDGVELLGNPIPVMENLDDPDATIARMSDTEKYTDWQGTTQARSVLRMDRNAVLFLGKGGKASMLGPAIGFTSDSMAVLKGLQILMMHHTRIPEFLFGGAIASSKASVETQMPPFVQYVKSRRLQLEGEGSDSQLNIEARGGILELVDVWLRMYKILNPAIVVAPAKIEWPEIGLENEQMRLQWGEFLSSTGKISDEDTVAMSGFFDDPAATVAKANNQTTHRPDFDALDKLLDAQRLVTSRDESDISDHDKTRNDIKLASDTDITEPGRAKNPQNDDDEYRIGGPTNWWGGL